MHLRRFLTRTLYLFAFVCALAGGFIAYALFTTPLPEHITYGMSFSVPYARELGLDWEEAYRAILDDLGVRHLRLAAYWPMVEPEEGVWQFSELDTQVRLAEERGASVILAIGRRLPRWPECHVPGWVAHYPEAERQAALQSYLTAVVERYRESPALLSWQVENEPFLTVYAREQCGALDAKALDEELAFVRKLDPIHPVLVTDSGNLGLWYGAYRRGDRFGTSVYVYLWNEATGAFRTFLPPEMYVVKRALMQLLFGRKDALLIELSGEPWLSTPIATTDLTLQLERMNAERFTEVVAYARRTRFGTQYLWGAEWWYWLKERGRPELWDHARPLYVVPPQEGGPERNTLHRT